MYPEIKHLLPKKRKNGCRYNSFTLNLKVILMDFQCETIVSDIYANIVKITGFNWFFCFLMHWWHNFMSSDLDITKSISDF